MIRAALLLVLGAAVATWVTMFHAGVHANDHPVGSTLANATGGLRLQYQAGVSPATAADVLADLVGTRRLVDADFGVTRRPLLTVRLYKSQASFGRALLRLEGVRPEGLGDVLGNVVHATLPLGPPNYLLRHNLVHVYTEWVLDRLTGNDADRQPDPAWLYDGIAEWEANRRVAALPCSLHGAYPLALSSIATSRDWWRTRGGVMGSLEYCEAQVAATALIQRAGFPAVRTLLHRAGSWPRFVRALLAVRATVPASS